MLAVNLKYFGLFWGVINFTDAIVFPPGPWLQRIGVALLTPTIAEFSAGRKFVAGPPGMLDSAYYLCFGIRQAAVIIIGQASQVDVPFHV